MSDEQATAEGRRWRPPPKARRILGKGIPQMLQHLWYFCGLFLAKRRRRLMLEPPLAFIITILETLQLLLLLQLLLMTVNRESSRQFTFMDQTLRASFTTLAIAAGVSALAGAALRFTEARLVGGLAAEATRLARQSILETYFAVDWEESRKERAGHLQHLLGVNAQQAVIPVLSLSTLAMSTIALTIYGVVIITMAPVVAASFLALTISASAIFRPLRRRSKKVALSASDALRDLQFGAASYVQLNRELHVFGATRQAVRKLGGQNNAITASFRSVRMNARLLPALFQQFLLSGVLLIVIIARGVDLGATDIGAAAILAIRSLSYVQQYNNATQQFIEARPYLDELGQAINNQRLAHRRRGTRALDKIRSLELSQMDYRYDIDHPILSSISLRIQPGQWLGIIGPSGSGKTTLANVLVGLLAPTGGAYLVNGVRSVEFDEADWVASFSILSQEPVLLRSTIAENISFHRNFGHNDVLAAAELASVRREIELLPLGFETIVGDGASSLSGGQRQRVALARAMVTQPQVLILDEPTSALDAENEKVLEKALSELPCGTTVVVISHRPALLSRCDRFVRLEHGRITAAGGAMDVQLDQLLDTHGKDHA